MKLKKNLKYQINDRFIKHCKKMSSICEKYSTCTSKTSTIDETFIGILGRGLKVESSSKIVLINRISVMAHVGSLVSSTRTHNITSLTTDWFLESHTTVFLFWQRFISFDLMVFFVWLLLKYGHQYSIK